METTPSAADKPVNRMDRLSDMGHFPASVNAGATLNVLLTIAVTWLLVPRYPQVYAPVLWIALSLNLFPVALLRMTLVPETNYPPLGGMSFLQDQHKFSDWVYLAASANMAFWVLGAWTAFALRYKGSVLALVLCTAALATLSPVLVRFVRHEPPMASEAD